MSSCSSETPENFDETTTTTEKSSESTSEITTTSTEQTTTTKITTKTTRTTTTKATTTIPYSENYHGHVYTGGEKSKKYHYEANCPGKNSHEITWDEVSRRNLGPCGTCVLK